MKANKTQNYLCDVILSQQSFWRNELGDIFNCEASYCAFLDLIDD